MMIDPQIPDSIATCGGTPHAISMPTAKGVITDAACSSARILRNPQHVTRMGRDGTHQCNCDVVVSSPWDNRLVTIAGIVVPPTMVHSRSQGVLNGQQSISPSVSRNSQKSDASVDRNLAEDGDSTAIFIKVLGHKLYDSLSADIYSGFRVDFMSNAVGTKAPDFVHLGLPAVNSSDEFNTFGAPLPE